MNARILFIVGTVHWFLLMIGHPILVDINLVLGLPGPLGPEVLADGDRLRAALIANTWDFGWLGKTTAHRAFSGYSIWLWTSTLFLGLIDVVIGLSPELPRVLLYRLTLLNLLAYVVFTVFLFIFIRLRAPLQRRGRHHRIRARHQFVGSGGASQRLNRPAGSTRTEGAGAAQNE